MQHADRQNNKKKKNELFPSVQQNISLQEQTLCYTSSTLSTTLQKQDKKDIPSHTYQQPSANTSPSKASLEQESSDIPPALLKNVNWHLGEESICGKFSIRMFKK